MEDDEIDDNGMLDPDDDIEIPPVEKRLNRIATWLTMKLLARRVIDE